MKNKVFFIFIIMFFVFFINSNVFAEDEIDTSDLISNVPDFSEILNNSKGILLSYSDNKYCLRLFKPTNTTFDIYNDRKPHNNTIIFCPGTVFSGYGRQIGSAGNNNIYLLAYATYFEYKEYYYDDNSWILNNSLTENQNSTVKLQIDTGSSNFLNEILFCNFDLFLYDNSYSSLGASDKLARKADLYNFFLEKPFISNTEEELKSGNIEYVYINSGGYHDSFFIGLSLYSYDNSFDENMQQTYSIIYLKGEDDKYFFQKDDDGSYIYRIPVSDLALEFVKDNTYKFELWSYFEDEEGNIFEGNLLSSVSFQVGVGIVEDSDKVLKDEFEKQNELLKEQNETSKGIFDTLKDVLSYINPFSENFFVYKLIELLIEAIKSLFIPEDGFFGNFFDDLKNWFSERLGFLFYPFELIIDILNKILNIDFSEPIFNVPDIKEPFSNTLLISSTEYNLNSLLDNEVFKNVHNIYLLCVDAFIIFALVNLAKRKFDEVMK